MKLAFQYTVDEDPEPGARYALVLIEKVSPGCTASEPEPLPDREKEGPLKDLA